MAGMPAATTVDDGVAQFGDAIVLALDVGELGVIPENEAAELAATISTVVDLRGPAPELVRVGAVGVAELRAVCPDLVDSTAV